MLKNTTKWNTFTMRIMRCLLSNRVLNLKKRKNAKYWSGNFRPPRPGTFFERNLHDQNQVRWVISKDPKTLDSMKRNQTKSFHTPYQFLNAFQRLLGFFGSRLKQPSPLLTRYGQSSKIPISQLHLMIFSCFKINPRHLFRSNQMSRSL